MTYFSGQIHMGNGNYSAFLSSLALRQAKSVLSYCNALQQVSKTEDIYNQLLIDKKKSFDDFSTACGLKNENINNNFNIYIYEVYLQSYHKYKQLQKRLLIKVNNLDFINGQTDIFLTKSKDTLSALSVKDKSLMDNKIFYPECAITVTLGRRIPGREWDYNP